ncbi:glycoside hydrolase family 3 C-terminal domain-containing protein [Actinacidiphila sp. ITFR-21]|uniref:glycoside hydrolase family 3 C-terminal domain-containing protein n=1 Tax=Actinacidiphila sp. ITFR-21 TaxID=3075199 RepID=UPI00288A3915|nr:glycoside hydrolase family 3 C-terminal domain-containing protein [Streptomyces sp. ITFR-21]WNI19043.1 glycoside hydrolase family 3 C-terminal domain-containing protein [Streptomyces sp. ITFR-21]
MTMITPASPPPPHPAPPAATTREQAAGPVEPTAAELDALVAALDLPAKVRLLSGAAAFRLQAEPAVGLRAIGVSDGPAGVRGERWDERDTSLALPSPTALAASWDDGLVTELGGLLAAEARRKGVGVLLAPTLNLHRSPGAGRHFECYSEDPLLTGRTAAAYIRGVQAGGVAATAKHYVANDSETERLTLDARLDQRTLRELYLAPFEAAVRAGVWTVMSAYNGVNGATMSESPLLAEPLKGEWGFDGVVVSDWGAVRSTEAAALAAQDLAMPGPEPRWGEPLLAAVREGRVPEKAIDDKVRRILLLAARVGALDSGPAPRDFPTPGDARGLLRRAVAAGCVLLRNEGGLLPLAAGDPVAPRRIAVIGPNAAAARFQGGGSAAVFPEAVVSPLDGIRGALSDTGTTVIHAEGAVLTTRPTPLHTGNARDPRTGTPGVLVRYLAADGTEIHTEHRLSGRILESGDAPELADTAAAVEVSALVTVDTPGEWRFSVVGLDAVVLTAGGEVLLDTYVTPESQDPTYLHVTPAFRTAVRRVDAGRELLLTATRHWADGHGHAVALAMDPPRRDEDALIAEAVEAARAADTAIVVVGTTDEIESEGFDRPSLALPGRQDELVAAVVAANPRTVVIVNSGGPVELPWRESAPAVLLCWFPGQEAGHGLADVLFGRAEPGGRLPTTWGALSHGAPPPHPSTTPTGGVLRYDEGPYLGHRAWRRAGAEPAYWFGHGLGYTTWAYEQLDVTGLDIATSGGAARDVAAPDGAGPAALATPVTARVTVRNTGGRPGREVVQLYLTTGPDPYDDGGLRLAGYAAVTAGPGEQVVAEIPVAPRVFERWSPEHGRWEPRPGPYTLHAGPSAARQPLSRPPAP